MQKDMDTVCNCSLCIVVLMGGEKIKGMEPIYREQLEEKYAWRLALGRGSTSYYALLET